MGSEPFKWGQSPFCRKKGFDPVGVILAGGRSSRFGGSKALAELGGKPLIGHVIERLRPQVDLVALSVEKASPDLDFLGLEQIEDLEVGVQGPLPALRAAMRWLATKQAGEWLLLAPCDTPFIPVDLVQRLLDRALETGSPGCVPRYQGELQPATSLWHVSARPQLRRAVVAGLRGFRQFLHLHPVAVLDWPADDPAEDEYPGPFFNVNTHDDLQTAARWLATLASVNRVC